MVEGKGSSIGRFSLVSSGITSCSAENFGECSISNGLKKHFRILASA